MDAEHKGSAGARGEPAQESGAAFAATDCSVTSTASSEQPTSQPFCALTAVRVLLDIAQQWGAALAVLKVLVAGGRAAQMAAT